MCTITIQSQITLGNKFDFIVRAKNLRQGPYVAHKTICSAHQFRNAQNKTNKQMGHTYFFLPATKYNEKGCVLYELSLNVTYMQQLYTCIYLHTYIHTYIEPYLFILLFVFILRLIAMLCRQLVLGVCALEEQDFVSYLLTSDPRQRKY